MGDRLDTEAIKQFLSTTAIDFGIKVLAALTFWFIGRDRPGHRADACRDGSQRGRPTLIKYLGSIVSVALNIALVLGILGYFGIETTSFAALIAGAGVAIGAAWSGMLGNFAVGAFMLVLRPFKVGDLVSVAGVTGTVHELGLFGTTLITGDNVLTMAKIPNVAVQPPEMSLLDMDLIGPVIAVRPYTNTANYWQVYFDTNEAIVRVCRDAGWPAPTPSQIVRQVEDTAPAAVHGTAPAATG